MKITGVSFPEAHLDARSMARLALAGHTILGFDNVMPVFSTKQESSSLGAPTDWGSDRKMPTGRPMAGSMDDPVPLGEFDKFLTNPPMRAVLGAIGILKRELGDSAAVQGKVMGPWSLAFDLYGLETFLVATLIQPDEVRRVLRQLMPVVLASARAQVDAGADCLTVADHCTRDLCGPHAYRDFLMEWHMELAKAIPVPLVLHVCGDTTDRIKYFRETGMAMFHFDSKNGTAASVREARGMPLMGGTGNVAVVRNGNTDIIKADVDDKLTNRIAVLGPECAVPLDAPANNLVLFVKEATQRMKNI